MSGAKSGPFPQVQQRTQPQKPEDVLQTITADFQRTDNPTKLLTVTFPFKTTPIPPGQLIVQFDNPRRSLYKIAGIIDQIHIRVRMSH